MFSRIKRYFHNKEAKAIVLMYHRVCNTETDPWQLAVSPNNFESQISEISKSFNVLALGDLQGQINRGAVKHKTVYITFDDAYFDNYLNAKPILEKYSCPATFFIPTSFIGKQQLFWWDELEAIILHSKSLPSNLSLKIDENSYTFSFEIEELSSKIKEKQQAWHWPKEPPTNRCKLYLKLWEVLKPLPSNKISASINVIRQWAGFNPVFAPNNYPMNTEQLKSLVNHKLFNLGIHTVSHTDLGNNSKEVQASEIADSKAFLERSFSKANTIAYPYGSYNNETISLVKQNEIVLGFTTNEEVVTHRSSPLCLGRFQVNNYSGAVLKERLSHYLN